MPGERTRPRLSESVLLSPSDDGYLAYDLSTDRLHQLNAAAALLVECCDGAHSIDELRSALGPLVSDEAWPPYASWIDSALDSGLLVDAAFPSADGPLSSAEALAARARELRDDDRVTPAFLCQKRAAELAPDDPHMWYALGELAHIVGRRDEARAAYERYFERHPEDAEIEHILVSLRNEAAPARAPQRCIEQIYARFASFYDENMSDELEYSAPALVADALGQTLHDAGRLRILDLGCGTGLSGVPLRARARWLVGVDLSPEMIDRANERAIYDALHIAEIADWLADNEGDPYDVIVLCDMLIYFGDLRQVIVPAARRLAPGGAIAFTVERGETYPFCLTDSGRFTHHRDHVAEVAREAGLTILRLDEAVLRYEYGEPVDGLVTVLGAAS